MFQTRPLAASTLLVCSLIIPAFGESTVIYKTGFEKSEGYDPNFTLMGQRGWVGEGTGGNGLVTSIPQLGQQAYIGFFPPAGTNQATTIYSPLNFTPPNSVQLVKFSVLAQIFVSTAGGDDEFRWAVYNIKGDRLFSIDFFTGSQRIYYELQDRTLIDTGWNFGFATGSDDGIYTLEIWMDFARNSWTALLNGAVLANAQKIAQQPDTTLNLGDVDVVWAIDNTQAVGNNEMLFDDYAITAETLSAAPSVLEPRGPNGHGNFEFTLYTQPGVKYSVDATENFQQWFSLNEFVSTQSTYIFEDTTSQGRLRKFYRLREIP